MVWVLGEGAVVWSGYKEKGQRYGLGTRRRAVVWSGY